MADEEEAGEDLISSIGNYTGDRNSYGQRHGNGNAVLPNGDTYIGHYSCGLRHGQGTYRWFKNGSSYNGTWLYNKKHGFGTFVYPDGSKYEGFWKDGAKNGYGIYFYVNGDTYDGMWKDNKKHGVGIYLFKNIGSAYIGEWVKGNQKGFGHLIHQGHRYVGSFNQNKPFGYGRYIFDYGWEVKGKYAVLQDEDIEVSEEHPEEKSEQSAVWVGKEEMESVSVMPVPPMPERQPFGKFLPEDELIFMMEIDCKPPKIYTESEVGEDVDDGEVEEGAVV